MVMVVFETPGVIDIRALTTFGVHSKPNTQSPIGHFGTGLKYAIAVILRHKLNVTLFIGDTEYVFYTKTAQFRDTEIEAIRMKKRTGLLSRWQYTDMPFTTQLGKNWELWQAYRELHANTLDENGVIYLTDIQLQTARSYTRFIVSGEAFVDVYRERNRIFLPEGLVLNGGNENDGLNVQVIKEPSKHIYWRGMRVMDLEFPSIYTYNILDKIDLTEDRTAKYAFLVEAKIVEHIAQSDDMQLIAEVTQASDKFFEGHISWDYIYSAPGQSYLDWMAKADEKQIPVTHGARAYYTKYSPKVKADADEHRSYVNSLIDAVESGDPDELWDLIDNDRNRFCTLLRETL